MWLRVRRPPNTLIYASGYAVRTIAASNWTREDVELRVPPDALSLSYGIALVGEGEASIDGVEITALDR